MKLLSGLTLLSLSQGYGQVISDRTCNSDDIVLYFDNQIEDSFEAFLSHWNATCTDEQCELQPSDPISGFLNWNYGGPNFAMRSSCPARRNFRTCEVTSTVYHRFSEGGIEVRGYIVEENKGVCFPPSCSDDQVNILDPEPGRCDPSTMDCEIVSYEVNCPSRQTTSGNCEQDQLPPTSPFFIARGASELAIIADCTSLFSGGNSIGLCSATTGEINASLKTDFTDFKTDSTYIDHERLCLEKGGQLCSFDMIGEFTIPGPALEQALSEVLPVSNAGDVKIRNQFIEFPRCLASTCGEDTYEDVLANHLNTYFLAEFGLTCDLDSDDCNINISNVQCKKKEPTPAPIPVTLSPTKSPTNKPILDTSTGAPTPATNLETSTEAPTPATKITLSPTLKPTQSSATDNSTPTPTSSPTQGKKIFSQPPSKFLSESPSNWSTVAPSLSSNKPSNLPSYVPSGVSSSSPSQALSDSPSVAPTVASSTLPSETNSANPSATSSAIPSSLPTPIVSETAGIPKIGPDTIFSSGHVLSYGQSIITIFLFWFLGLGFI